MPPEFLAKFSKRTRVEGQQRRDNNILPPNCEAIIDPNDMMFEGALLLYV